MMISHHLLKRGTAIAAAVAMAVAGTLTIPAYTETKVRNTTMQYMIMVY
jgi:hypothetical protein